MLTKAMSFQVSLKIVRDSATKICKAYLDFTE